MVKKDGREELEKEALVMGRAGGVERCQEMVAVTTWEMEVRGGEEEEEAVCRGHGRAWTMRPGN